MKLNALKSAVGFLNDTGRGIAGRHTTNTLIPSSLSSVSCVGSTIHKCSERFCGS